MHKYTFALSLGQNYEIRFLFDQRLMESAFSDSLLASGGLVQPPEISGTTKGVTMKFLRDVGIHRETRNQKSL